MNLVDTLQVAHWAGQGWLEEREKTTSRPFFTLLCILYHHDLLISQIDRLANEQHSMKGTPETNTYFQVLVFFACSRSCHSCPSEYALR